MLKYIFQRLGLMLITFVVITVITYFLIALVPFDPSERYRDPITGILPPHIEDMIREEGWGEPVPVRFAMWIRNIFGDRPFGRTTSQPMASAWAVLQFRIPQTVRLNVIPFFISIPLAVTLGTLAAIKKNKWQDHAISTFVVLFVSLPTFVVAVLLQLILVFRLGWIESPFVLPPSLAQGDFWGNIQSRIMPTIVLSLGTIAGLTRTLRAELTEVITSDFMLLARAKGLSTRQATFRHALRNGFVPFAPILVVGFVGLLGGSMVIEQIFGVPGVGPVFITAFASMDMNVLMLVSVFFTFIGLLAGIAGDLSYGFIDPRIKMGRGKTNA